MPSSEKSVSPCVRLKVGQSRHSEKTASIGSREQQNKLVPLRRTLLSVLIVSTAGLSIRGTSYFLPMIETAEPPSEGVMLMA